MTTANHALHMPPRIQIYNGIEMTVERAQALEESRQQTVIRKRSVDLASRSFAIVILLLGIASPIIAQKSVAEKGTPSHTQKTNSLRFDGLYQFSNEDPRISGLPRWHFIRFYSNGTFAVSAPYLGTPNLAKAAVDLKYVDGKQEGDGKYTIEADKVVGHVMQADKPVGHFVPEIYVAKAPERVPVTLTLKDGILTVQRNTFKCWRDQKCMFHLAAFRAQQKEMP